MNSYDHEKLENADNTSHPFIAYDYQNFPMTRLNTQIITSSLYPINRWGFLPWAVFVVFGGIHCAAWNFSFPSKVARWAWRASSLILGTSIPFTWVLTRIILFLLRRLGETDEIGAVSDIRINILGAAWGSRRFTILIKADWVARIIHGTGLMLYVCAGLYLFVGSVCESEIFASGML